MSQATQIRVPTTKVGPVRTHSEQVKYDKQHAEDYDHYYVMLRSEATDLLVRARTPVYYLDEDRRPILGEDGQPKIRSPFDASLDVWAAWGADEFEFIVTNRGAMAIVTPQGLMGHIESVEAAKQMGIIPGGE